MGKKSRFKKERRENGEASESTISTPHSTIGMYMSGGDGSVTIGNTIVGFDEGVRAHDSPYSVFALNTIVAKGSEHVIKDVQAFVSDVRARMGDLNLDSEQTSELNSELDTLDSQIKSPKPKVSILLPCLESAKNILENAAGSALGTLFVENVENLITSLSSAPVS